jgi:hypothetical protein
VIDKKFHFFTLFPAARRQLFEHAFKTPPALDGLTSALPAAFVDQVPYSPLKARAWQHYAAAAF